MMFRQKSTFPKAVNSYQIFLHIEMKKVENKNWSLIKRTSTDPRINGKGGWDKENDVLYWLLVGITFRWIDLKLNVSHTSVQLRERVLYDF